MPGPTDDRQFPTNLPTLVIPSSISNKMGQFSNSSPIRSAQTSNPVTYNQGLFGVGGVTLPPIISPGGKSVMAPNANPVNYNMGLFQQGAGGASFGRIFSNQNPILQGMGGILGAGVRGNLPAFQAPQGAGGGTGMHPEEARWKLLADKFKLDWNVTKNTYMRSPRNPNFDPARAMDLQLDDRDWGDAAYKAGILRQPGTPENDAWNNQVWVDHYNANGNMAADPMAGHDYAIQDYLANQQRTQNMVNGTPKPPEWL